MVDFRVWTRRFFQGKVIPFQSGVGSEWSLNHTGSWVFFPDFPALCGLTSKGGNEALTGDDRKG